MKRLSVLGSTGSIGRGVLRIVEAFPKRFKVVTLAARSNSDLLYKQAIRFRPRLVCIFDPRKAGDLARKLRPKGIRVVSGEEGLREAATFSAVQMTVFALVGVKGLQVLLDVIRLGKAVAIANKESLVMAGGLIRNLAQRHHVKLIPIDSEHSAMWQCLEGHSIGDVKRLVLTASGGPFCGWSERRLRCVTPRQALRHPRWRMGKKITVDSATLMNKGFEVIEACSIFGVGVDRVRVLVHPEAIVHSMVEFVDGSVLAQLSVTSMDIPIKYALTYPQRFSGKLPALDLEKVGPLHFNHPRRGQFPCLELAYEVGRRGGTLPAVLNAADEVLVVFFLSGKIDFLQIHALLERIVTHHRNVKNPNLNDILQADKWAREEALRLC